MIILDIGNADSIWLVNLNRPFNPENMTEFEFFNDQLNKLDILMTAKTIIMGDFNLDLNKENCENYAKKNYLNTMANILGHHNTQIQFKYNFHVITLKYCWKHRQKFEKGFFLNWPFIVIQCNFFHSSWTTQCDVRPQIAHIYCWCCISFESYKQTYFSVYVETGRATTGTSISLSSAGGATITPTRTWKV